MADKAVHGRTYDLHMHMCACACTCFVHVHAHVHVHVVYILTCTCCAVVYVCACCMLLSCNNIHIGVLWSVVHVHAPSEPLTTLSSLCAPRPIDTPTPTRPKPPRFDSEL